jgi:hypothetical protein
MSEQNTQINNQQTQPAEQQPSFFSRILKMLFFMFLFSQIGKYFAPKQKENQLRNIFLDDMPFDINFYIHSSRFPEEAYYVEKKLKPILTINNVKYHVDGKNDAQNQTQHEYEIIYDYNIKNLINMTDAQLKDQSLFLYATISSSESSDLFIKFNLPSNEIFFENLNILKFSDNYADMIRQKNMMDDLEAGSMANDELGLNKVQEGNNSSKINGTSSKEFIPNLYYKPDVTLYLSSLESHEDVMSFEELRIIGKTVKVNYKEKLFAPVSYLTDFWTLSHDLQPVEKSNITYTSQLKLKISFRFITMFYLKNMMSVEMQSNMMEKNFQIPAMKDTMVEIIKNNSITYLTILFTVNILHTVFSALGFASDVSYYKNLKNLDGVYTKHMFFDMFRLVVAGIYVTIEGAHFIVKIELIVGALIEVWKLRKVFSFSFKKNFPFISFTHKIQFQEESSKDFESEAVSITMKYLFFPVAIIYLVYRIYYYSHRITSSPFRFVIEYIFFLMNVFGFILMTPQIYLNWKMKSVENMPVKALTYKFLNTIIDDLYAFAVKTPTLYRIFCFKDDVIFVIFIYQLIAYRKNVRFSQNAETKTPLAAAQNKTEQLPSEIKEKKD